MDILDPLPRAQGDLKFLLVGVDYFTKWIEAEPLRAITAANIQKFTWKRIICRYGLPHSIITDNGTQFKDRNFEAFLAQLGIKHYVTSVEHPQTNGQAESANKIILRGLRTKLDAVKSLWTEELPSVLWAYHCTPQSSTGETPYRLTYGTDAMIPVEVGEPSLRRNSFAEDENDETLRVELDLLEEIREEARVKEAAAKARATRKYDSKVREREFRAGDLVWRARGEARKDRQEGKLASAWEGPFRVVENLHNGAYRLQTLTGRDVPRTWNASHLKFYFS